MCDVVHNGPLVPNQRTPASDSPGWPNTLAGMNLDLMPEVRLQQPPLGLLPLLLTEWTLWQQARGLAARTIADRVALIARMPDPLDLTPAFIDKWLTQPHLSVGSRRAYHAQIKAWCQWLVKTGRRVDDPTILAPPPKAPKGLPRPLADAHVEALLSRTPMYRRTRVMILLGLLAGLRVSEIASIKGEQFDHLAGLLFITGKGSKERAIPIHPDLRLVADSMPTRGLWFRTPVGNTTAQPGGPILHRTVSTTVSKAMTRAGISSRYTPHSLRHTFATRLVRAGVGIEKVRILMGHESLVTTQIYTQVGHTFLHDAINSLPSIPPHWIDVSKAFRFED